MDETKSKEHQRHRMSQILHAAANQLGEAEMHKRLNDKRLLERVGLSSPEEQDHETSPLTESTMRRLVVYPLPKNMGPGESEGRRAARARALLLQHQNDEGAVYVDVAKVKNKDAYVAAAVAATTGKIVTSCSVRTRSASQAEEMAIALAARSPGVRTILSDSKTAIRTGERALEYRALFPQPPNCGTLPILPHPDPGLAISITIPGIWAKWNTPKCVLQQESAAVIKQRLAGRLLIFTGDSVRADGAAAAACVVPALGLHGQCRLSFTASSTTAELAATDLAADQLAELLPPTAVVLCDLRSALLALARSERGVPIAQRIVRKFVFIQSNPIHPDSRVATGNPPRPLPRTGIGRRARAFLLCVRTDCSRTAELQFRRTNSGSPARAECPADETIERVLLQCPGYTHQRRRLFDA
ncbi:hypothetical protein MRX96_005427 [Rhipicephalus microplus]